MIAMRLRTFVLALALATGLSAADKAPKTPKIAKHATRTAVKHPGPAVKPLKAKVQKPSKHAAVPKIPKHKAPKIDKHKA